jgi:hypothetical protein
MENEVADDRNQQTKGRQENAAQPLGARKGLVSDKGTEKTGRTERKTAGPDGPSAAEVGKTFKR